MDSKKLAPKHLMYQAAKRYAKNDEKKFTWIHRIFQSLLIFAGACAILAVVIVFLDTLFNEDRQLSLKIWHISTVIFRVGVAAALLLGVLTLPEYLEGLGLKKKR